MSAPFNSDRIADHPDKVLLARISEYFAAFAVADAVKMDSMVAEDYHMTDIPLGIVRSTKSDWFNQNRAFGGLMTDISVEAISLHGSSEPGSFAVMENVVRFTLKIDPPEAAKPNLPPGIKKGESSGMIMCSTIWWDAEGKVSRELEYGKLLWPGFDINEFNDF